MIKAANNVFKTCLQKYETELLGIRAGIYKSGPAHHLFKPEHFIFCTIAEGRSPSFYFHRKGAYNYLLSGRLRTMHQDGPLIEVYDSRSIHLFTDRKDNLDTLENDLRGVSLDDMVKYFNNLEQGIQITSKKSPVENKSLFEGNQPLFRATPRNGDFHYEFVMVKQKPRGGNHRHDDKIPYYHPSSGQVDKTVTLSEDNIDEIVEKILSNGAYMHNFEKIIRPYKFRQKPFGGNVRTYLSGLKSSQTVDTAN